MPTNPLEFSALMEQIRDGSSTASHELVTKYGAHILRVVRQKLDKAFRPKFDSQDFVQAVWASFFAFRPERIAFDQPGSLHSANEKARLHEDQVKLGIKKAPPPPLEGEAKLTAEVEKRIRPPGSAKTCVKRWATRSRNRSN